MSVAEQDMIPLYKYENRLAESLGFSVHADPHRGDNWCKFQQGDVHVWTSRHWVRAHMCGGAYSHHTKHHTLAEALLGVNGTAYGPYHDLSASALCSLPPERKKPGLEIIFELFPSRDDFVVAAMSSRLFRNAGSAKKWWDKACRS